MSFSQEGGFDLVGRHSNLTLAMDTTTYSNTALVGDFPTGLDTVDLADSGNVDMFIAYNFALSYNRAG